jgi:hypothetical protein
LSATPAPVPPLTELAAAAIAAHELFRAYAGFTESQALYLVRAILLAGIRVHGDQAS